MELKYSSIAPVHQKDYTPPWCRCVCVCVLLFFILGGGGIILLIQPPVHVCVMHTNVLPPQLERWTLALLSPLVSALPSPSLAPCRHIMSLCCCQGNTSAFVLH